MPDEVVLLLQSSILFPSCQLLYVYAGLVLKAPTFL